MRTAVFPQPGFGLTLVHDRFKRATHHREFPEPSAFHALPLIGNFLHRLAFSQVSA